MKPYFEKGTEFRIIFSKSACFNFSGVISKKHCKKLHVKTGIFFPNFDFWPKTNSGMNRPVKFKKYIIVYFIYQKLDIDNISMTIYYPEFTPYSSPEIGVISAPVKYRGAGGDATTAGGLGGSENGCGGIGFGFNPSITSARVIRSVGSLAIILTMTALAK